MQAAERELLDGDRRELVEIGLVEDHCVRVVGLDHRALRQRAIGVFRPFVAFGQPLFRRLVGGRHRREMRDDVGLEIERHLAPVIVFEQDQA